MVQAHSVDDELRQIQRDLEQLLAALFDTDPQLLRPLVKAIDPDAVADISWQGSARKVSTDVCDTLRHRLGAWEAVYRLIEVLNAEYARNPDVAALHHRVCASSYSGPLTASHTTREQAVREFVSRHFADESEELRSFDERGATSLEDGPLFLPESDFQAASHYFESIANGLHAAHVRTVAAHRLDVVSYILEGALDYRSCRGLFLQIRRALATPAFLRQSGERLFTAIHSVQNALTDYLDVGLWPPTDHEVCEELCRALPDPQSLPATQEQRAVLTSFTATLRALVLLEGLGIAEPRLLQRIDAEIPELERHIAPRLAALLRYRRCLAFVYCGDWAALRHQLGETPNGWDPNWSGFLWYELGEFDRCLAAYSLSRGRSGSKPLDRGVALRSLLALIPLEQSRSTSVVPLPDDDPSSFITAARRRAEASRSMRLTRRAELELAINAERRHLPAAQALFEPIFMLRLTAECGRVTVSARHAAELESSGRGFSIGHHYTAPLTRAYHAFWLCGIPTIELRSDASSELVQTALRTQPLRGVFEAAHITCAVEDWDRERLLDAVSAFIQHDGIEAWRTLLVGQVAFLGRCVNELLEQDLLANASGEVLHAHPIATRARGLVSLFCGLMHHLPTSSLREVSDCCLNMLRRLGTNVRNCDTLAVGGLRLILGSWTRSPDKPHARVEPGVVAQILTAAGLLDMNLCRALRPVWPKLEASYRSAFVESLYGKLAEWPETMLGEIFGEGDEALTNKIERFFSSSENLTPIPNAVLMREVARHWSDGWRNNGYGNPPLRIDDPTTLEESDTETLWSDWRPRILQALDEGRLHSVEPFARRWVQRGIYGLSALALQFKDVALWIRLFEQVRPWPLVSEGFGCDLTILRRALEDDQESALRRRFTRRLLSADTGGEWTAIVQVFCFCLRSGRRILLDDVETLRTLWERTHVRDLAALQIHECLRLVLERLTAEDVAVDDPRREHLEFVLGRAPAKIRQGGLASHELGKQVLTLCTAVESRISHTSASRKAWTELRVWMGALRDEAETVAAS